MSLETHDNALVEKIGHINFYYNEMSFAGQDLLRLLICKLGDPALSIDLLLALNGASTAISAFAKELESPKDELVNLVTCIGNLRISMEIAKTINSVVNLSNIKKRKEQRKWQIFEYIGAFNSVIPQIAIAIAGSYLALLLNGHKTSKEVSQNLLKLVLGDEDLLNDKQQRSLARMQLDAINAFSDRTLKLEDGGSFETRLANYYNRKMFYADDKTKQHVLDRHTLTKDEYRTRAIQLRSEAENGNHHSLIIILAALLGIPKLYVEHVTLVGFSSDSSSLMLDINNGTIHFDLQVVAPFSKVAKQTAVCIDSNTILVKPLPKFLFELLEKLYLQADIPCRIGDLFNTSHDADTEHFSATKFINSGSRFAIQQGILDEHEAAYVNLNFASLQHAKLYYRNTTRQKAWEACNKFYEALGWGEPVDFVSGLPFGSRVLVRDEVLANTFAILATEVERLRPSPRSSIKQLLSFHDAFCAYTATFVVFCLALRSANPYRLKARELSPTSRFVLINDKAVHGMASMQPVTVTHSLQSQIRYWYTHCQALSERMMRSGVDKHDSFVKALLQIASHQNVALLVLSQSPHPLNSARLKSFWPNAIEENFARHYWETRFPALGVNSREISAHLRHQSKGNLNWSAASDLVLIQQIERISNAQETILSRLEIKSIHGLSKRVASYE